VAQRTPNQPVISVSLSRKLLAQIDVRAASLNLPRSHYLTLLAVNDINKGGPLTIGPEAQQARMELIREITEFMKHAVPALKAYQENLKNPKALEALDETPEAMEENQFWPDFMGERDDILTLKWFESQKEGKDIGFERALQMWVHWRPEQEADLPASGT
jgi:hypothetical protein